jgi:hypothetical protein
MPQSIRFNSALRCASLCALAHGVLARTAHSDTAADVAAHVLPITPILVGSVRAGHTDGNELRAVHVTVHDWQVDVEYTNAEPEERLTIAAPLQLHTQVKLPSVVFGEVDGAVGTMGTTTDEFVVAVPADAAQ